MAAMDVALTTPMAEGEPPKAWGPAGSGVFGATGRIVAERLEATILVNI